MKKLYLLLFLGLFILTTGCSSKFLEKIDYGTLISKLDSKDTFVLYFYDDDSELENTLTKVLETNNLIGYKIDTNKIDNSQKLKLQTTIDYKEPCIVFIINGNDPTILSHITSESTTEERITNALKDMNFIK